MTRVLWIKLDDVGKEQFTTYGRGGAGTYGYGDTSVVTAMFAGGTVGGFTYPGGVKFTRHYAEQLCSPDRAACLTSRHPFRTGILNIVTEGQTGLLGDEVTIAQQLQLHGWQTACFGKWHLERRPELCGFDVYAGNDLNLDQTEIITAEGKSYSEGFYSWPMKMRGGRERTNRTYHTTACVSNAIRWIRDQGDRDWFCYLPLYGVHVPFTNNATTDPVRFNSPPTHLYDTATWTTAANVTHTTTQHTMHAYRAGLEAMCGATGELARLFASIDTTDTLVIFDCDNGTDTNVLANEVDPNFGAYSGSHAKNTPYEPAICVPLIMWGAGVSSPNRSYNHLVSCVDIMPTVLEVCGVDMPDRTVDGVSFASVLDNSSSAAIRTEAYSEWGLPLHAATYADRTATEWAMIGPTYKLLLNGISGTTEFYKLDTDPMEASNLTPLGSTSGLSAPALAEHTRLMTAFEELVP